MGTLGVPEMIFIFLLALVLFGPKKLPELGRTMGKALTEFRRASTELKSHADFSYPYDEAGQTGSDTPAVSHDSPATTNPSTVGASEVSSAESHGTTETAGAVVATLPPVEDTVPRSETTEPVQKQS
jgi:TatA/E family protein of Tat protein translocase